MPQCSAVQVTNTQSTHRHLGHQARGKMDSGGMRIAQVQLKHSAIPSLGHGKNSWIGGRVLEAQGKENHCTLHGQTPRVLELELNFIKLDKQLYWQLNLDHTSELIHHNF